MCREGEAPCAPYPYNYNNIINQAPISQQPAPVNTNTASQPVMPTSNNAGQIEPGMNTTLNFNQDQTGVAAQAEGAKDNKDNKTEENKDKKPKVALTDDYIKTLENYLNSKDKKVRLMGAKELFERFKEDETRKNDAALTALLNKSLQDPAETVKFMALTALDLGYASGNDETAQILTAMQNSDSSYGEDAALAAQILLKMSGTKANEETKAAQEKYQANLAGTNNVNAIPDDNNGGILMSPNGGNPVV